MEVIIKGTAIAPICNLQSVPWIVGSIIPVCGETAHRDLDPPPLKWSVLRYGFGPEEDRDGEEETHA